MTLHIHFLYSAIPASCDVSVMRCISCQHALANAFIHSFIMTTSIAPLQGDYYGALPIPVRTKRKVLRWAKKELETILRTICDIIIVTVLSNLTGLNM